MQFTSNEGMSNDECESEIDHYTGHYMPYSLRRVCGFFNFPQIFFITCARACETGLRFIVLIREDQKVKPFADVITKAALSTQLFKDPECWSGRGLNLRSPAQQTGAYPIELTRRRVDSFAHLQHTRMAVTFARSNLLLPAAKKK